MIEYKRHEIVYTEAGYFYVIGLYDRFFTIQEACKAIDKKLNWPFFCVFN